MTFGLLGTAIISLTFLPALTVTVLGWRAAAGTQSAGPASGGEGVAVPISRSGTARRA